MKLYILSALLIIFQTFTHGYVFINEIDVTTGTGKEGSETREFIELYNNESKEESLKGYFLVLFDGSSDPPLAYDVFSFVDEVIAENDVFLIGPEGFSPNPHKMFSYNKKNIQNGEDGWADAIALYKLTNGR